MLYSAQASGESGGTDAWAGGEGTETCDVEEDRRLVLAIEEVAGVDIMHQCGSHVHYATCRVECLEGEPEGMTEAEFMLLWMCDLVGEARLSCQVLSGSRT